MVDSASSSRCFSSVISFLNSSIFLDSCVAVEETTLSYQEIIKNRTKSRRTYRYIKVLVTVLVPLNDFHIHYFVLNNQ